MKKDINKLKTLAQNMNLEELKQIVNEVEEKQMDSWQGKRVLGFLLRRSRTTDRGKEYVKFYAFKSKKVDGQIVRANVYIGSDPNKAEEKIINYCKKHNKMILLQ